MTHPVDELDENAFDLAAIWAELSLRRAGYVALTLEPGDATTYPIIIVAPGDHRVFQGGDNSAPQPHVRPEQNYRVAVGLSRCGTYPWRGQQLSWDYVAQKWADDHEWTGRVICRFLNTLSDKMKEASDG